jgi:dTDP-4-amino-4,6-dideoxygalactose transaminase
VAVSSGTAALHLALLALGIGPGDEVITTPMTFIASCEAIVYTGARPVLADVDPATGCIDPQSVERAITEHTRAVMPVHLFGHAADMGPILQTARAGGLHVVEDAAQAHGALYNGRKLGALGDAGGYSFYPTKNLGAYGEGGAVVTNSRDTFERLKMLRDHGQTGRYVHGLIGYNYRMHAFQGAVLNVKLRHLDEWNERRRDIAARYTAGLASCEAPEGSGGLRLPREADHARCVWYQYAVRCDRRDALQAHLSEAGIGTRIHYAIPMSRQHALSPWLDGQPAMREAESMAATVLSLPIYPEMTDEQVDYVIDRIREFFD